MDFAKLTDAEARELIARIDANDVLVARLVQIVGQLQPGIWEALSQPVDRMVPAEHRLHAERVDQIILEIVEREREKVDRAQPFGFPT